MKNLPPPLNRNIHWLYNGSELSSLSDEHRKYVIDHLDPWLLLREEFEQKLKTEIFDPYNVFKHKFQVIRAIAAHVNHKIYTYLPQWTEIEEFMIYFEELVSDINFLATYRNSSLNEVLTGLGIKHEQTVELFCTALGL